MKSLWQDMADEFMASHPNVKIKITVLENEAFKAKLTTNMQAGTRPTSSSPGAAARSRSRPTPASCKDITDAHRVLDRHAERGGRRALQGGR